MKSNKKNVIKGRFKSVAIAALAFVIGMIVHRIFFMPFVADDHEKHASSMEQVTKQTVWTCSMHPQIKLPKPGKCPICFMDLIPLEDDESRDGGEREMTVTPYSAKLLELETAQAVKQFVEAEVRMVGKIDYDETRVSYISAWVPGRLDRLYVNYTGIPVKQGDHMVNIYSPDLLTAQEELVQALKTVEELKHSESEIVLRTIQTTVDAAREKLRLWGLNTEQIAAIEQRKKTSDHFTINAPSSGIVIHKNAQEGMYVQTGTKIYTIADISSVWVLLDAYESDLQWVRYGGKVEFTAEAYPGKIFSGTISFVDPIINPSTRTAKVRVVVPNESLALKPGMFVRAVVRSKVATDGQIMNQELAGKWISPMHPEIIKDEPGMCDVCGMPLVSAESLGYVNAQEQNAPLVIPVSAALKTGTRAVVYVEIPDREKPTYEGREVVLGHRLGNYYIVEDGLSEGERVVMRGAFKLDAELQIRAKPSMMSDDGTSSPPQHHHTKKMTESSSNSKPFTVPSDFRSQLNAMLNAYFALQQALADDNSQAAKTQTAVIKGNLEQVDMGLLKGNAHGVWMGHVKKLNASIENLLMVESLEKQRKYFAVLSNQLMLTIKLFPPLQQDVYKATCPMAFDNKGASWLQNSAEIANPYFGAMMLRCGSVDEKMQFTEGREEAAHE